MSDLHLRELERDAATGDPSAAARLLVARVRVGELEEHHLVLAAHVGHEPARLAIGAPSSSSWSSSTSTPEELDSAVRDLQRFGREVLVRSAVVAAELAGPVAVARGVAAPGWYQVLLETARAWLACPCPEHVTQAGRVTWGPMPHPFRGPGNTSKFACSVVVEPIDQATDCAVVAVGMAVDALESVTAVRDSIRSTLIGWSLQRSGVRSPS